MGKYEAVANLLLEYMKSTGEGRISEPGRTQPPVSGMRVTGVPASERPGSELQIPVGISNRHVHLSQADLDALFGCGYCLTPIKDLSQLGQYACRETLTVCGPKGVIEKLRILGPVRSQTQVEILAGDCFKLGVKAEPRLSGDLAGTSGVTLVGPKGSVRTSEGVIIAKRHIHMHPSDAWQFSVRDGETVKIAVDGPRGGIFHDVSIRVTEESSLEFHLDTEEANALGVTSRTVIRIVR